MIWMASLFAVVALFIFAVSLYGSLEITKIPYLAVPYTPKDYGLASEEVSFKSHDGLKLTGWFLPAKNPSNVTILVLHGLGSNAGDMLLNTLCLARTGRWNLFLFNFRGHADSEGHLTSLGPLELKDLESALAFVKAAKPEATQRLAIYGHSLGASVAIVGAARHPELEAVAAESPFARTRKTVAYFAKLFYGIPEFPFMYIAVFLARLRLGVSLWDFAPIQEIGKIAPRPFFLLHAERDLRMPASDTKALMQAAGEPKELWVVPGADHGEPWMVAPDEYNRRLVEFFRRVFP
jgi:pimeloyl-ACP methyl ester carboxylesterase